MHSRAESCPGILLRNHIMEPTLVICHNVNGDHQLGYALSSLLYNHCALFFSFTTISNLWWDTLRPCKCPAAYPLMRFSSHWWFLRDLIFIVVVTIYVCVCIYLSKVAQLCPTLCDPMDCSLPGSTLHGILQARVLEWVAISFSRGSSQPRDQTQVSRIPGRCFNLWATREAQ